MKFATAVLLFAATAATVQAQDVKHAPTVDVCRADVAVWWTDYIVQQYEASANALANGGKYLPNPAGDLSIKEASARATEMLDCENVDTRNAQTYSYAWVFYYGVRTDSYLRFVQRHGLLDQLFKEDAEGVR